MGPGIVSGPVFLVSQFGDCKMTMTLSNEAKLLNDSHFGLLEVQFAIAARIEAVGDLDLESVYDQYQSLVKRILSVKHEVMINVNIHIKGPLYLAVNVYKMPTKKKDWFELVTYVNSSI